MTRSSSDSTVAVRALSRSYFVPERAPGLRSALKSLVRRRTREVRAVDRISFDIAAGEIVGFLGPNGAGKTTALKMLSGLIYPTEGQASVLGFTPGERAPGFLKRITLVMGNRSQLQWDIPALDSFALNRAIYGIPESEFLKARDELIDLLDLQLLVHKPIRNLSLGERMKMEIVAALLHGPEILFLDEPTLGLDITMQRRIRTFVGEYNRRTGATVLLTSHYMADVTALCRRVIVIHHGRILVDGNLSELSERFAQGKTIVITFDGQAPDLSSYGEEIERAGARVKIRAPRADIAQITARLLSDHAVTDLNIEDPPIEDVIDDIFQSQPSA